MVAPTVTTARQRLRSYTRDGLEFQVSDRGPVSGPTIVLLHGFPQRATCWNGTVESLNRWGYRTFAPDQRGYSPRARPRTRTGYVLPALVEDAAALIDRIPGPVHLVGHDWGAVVAWTLASHHPERVQSLVAISAPHPRAYARSFVTSSQAVRSAYVAAFHVPWIPEAAARWVPRLWEGALRRAGMPPAAVERFRTEIVDDGALPGALGWYRALSVHGSCDATKRVKVPTTHIWSDGDAALTRAGAEGSGEYVDGPYRLVCLAGVSHWIPDDEPRLLAHLIDERAERRAYRGR